MGAVGLVIAATFRAFALRMLVSRWIERSQSFVVPLVFSFVTMSAFLWLAAHEPTA